MVCSSCGAENGDTATFCHLCLERFPGQGHTREPDRVAAMRRDAAIEHEWWVRRRAEYAESLSAGLPSRGGTYALVAFDRQVREWRAMWWSATVFAAFAGLSTMRVVVLDRASGSPLAVGIVQALLLASLGIAGACLLAATLGGPSALQGTLVNLFILALVGFLLAAAAVFGGPYALWVVSVLFLGAILVTAVAPLLRTPTRAVPVPA